MFLPDRMERRCARYSYELRRGHLFRQHVAAYDALSSAMQRFLDGLSATNAAAPVVARCEGLGISRTTMNATCIRPSSIPSSGSPRMRAQRLFGRGNYTPASSSSATQRVDDCWPCCSSTSSRSDPVALSVGTKHAGAVGQPVVQHCAIPDYHERRVMYADDLGHGRQGRAAPLSGSKGRVTDSAPRRDDGSSPLADNDRRWRRVRATIEATTRRGDS